MVLPACSQPSIATETACVNSQYCDWSDCDVTNSNITAGIWTRLSRFLDFDLDSLHSDICAQDCLNAIYGSSFCGVCAEPGKACVDYTVKDECWTLDPQFATNVENYCYRTRLYRFSDLRSLVGIIDHSCPSLWRHVALGRRSCASVRLDSLQVDHAVHRYALLPEPEYDFRMLCLHQTPPY